ncbi:MAG: sigma-70 family RNA polymerase sigma factor [Colwellia sp.]|nr:sigma-70 family RNA polymerase sigma factor [Colwellia sp.]
MNFFRKRKTTIDDNDSNLVMYSLGGDRDAFCQIVTRYQNLLCSLAYSSLGDIKHSEDMAQEVFVEAWKKLDTLQDPEKLKAWICGILRFKISHFRRKEERQPIKGADELDEHKLAESENSVLKSAELEQVVIQKQQHALLWQVLDEVDDIYREPLILFYREQQSIDRVAAELDLTPDTVKQRLSRGRKLLKNAMSSLVEDGLKNSKPGVAFTAVVMTAISSIAPPATAAALGVGVVKTGSWLKLATVITLLAVCSGLISSFFGLKSSLDQSRTKRERRLAIKSVMLFMSIAGIYVAGMFLLKHLALNNSADAWVYTVVSQLVVLAFVISYLVLVSRMFAATRSLRAQERLFEPQAFLREVDQQNSKRREYKSKLTLFGAPLIHIQFGMQENSDKPAFGWIAGGSYAHGLLFAWGGVAIAPISVGIVSFGIITIGAVGFGLFSTGTVAIGLVAFGSSAIGYKAYASLSSLGWESALSSGFSIAKEAAIGPIAYAAQVNNEQALELTNLTLFTESFQWVLAVMALLVIVPSIWYANKVKQRMR